VIILRLTLAEFPSTQHSIETMSKTGFMAVREITTHVVAHDDSCIGTTGNASTTTIYFNPHERIRETPPDIADGAVQSPYLNALPFPAWDGRTVSLLVIERQCLRGSFCKRLP
jgi:hypothetical protein